MSEDIMDVNTPINNNDPKAYQPLKGVDLRPETLVDNLRSNL